MLISYFFCIFAPNYSDIMNLKIFITQHLLGKRQKTFWGTLRTILLFPLAIVGDTCLVIAYLIALMVSNILEKYDT